MRFSLGSMMARLGRCFCGVTVSGVCKCCAVEAGVRRRLEDDKRCEVYSRVCKGVFDGEIHLLVVWNGVSNAGILWALYVDPVLSGME